VNSKELVILNNYKCYVTITGQSENFLIGDSGQEDERILIFHTQSWLAFLCESEVWYVEDARQGDGRYPPLFPTRMWNQ